MKIIMLHYEPESEFEARSNEMKDEFWAAWRAYHQALVDAGVYVDGNALQPASKAISFQVKDGKRHVQDGPYAESKEQLGGYMILELPSIEEALEWASRCPAASSGTVEIRPILTAASKEM